MNQQPLRCHCPILKALTSFEHHSLIISPSRQREHCSNCSRKCQRRCADAGLNGPITACRGGDAQRSLSVSLGKQGASCWLCEEAPSVAAFWQKASIRAASPVGKQDSSTKQTRSEQERVHLPASSQMTTTLVCRLFTHLETLVIFCARRHPVIEVASVTGALMQKVNKFCSCM